MKCEIDTNNLVLPVLINSTYSGVLYTRMTIDYAGGKTIWYGHELKRDSIQQPGATRIVMCMMSLVHRDIFNRTFSAVFDTARRRYSSRAASNKNEGRGIQHKSILCLLHTHRVRGYIDHKTDRIVHKGRPSPRTEDPTQNTE